MSAINEKLLDERLAALESARAWSPRVVSKLESHIRSADDAALLRINPMRFAAEKGIAEDEAVDLFLHAAALGLFEMNWIILCPICSCVIESFQALEEPRQPLPLHELPCRPRRRARRHDRGHLHGEPRDPATSPTTTPRGSRPRTTPSATARRSKASSRTARRSSAISRC